MEIRLDRAGPADRELLFRLLQYSLYEESAWDGNKIGEDGLFAYPWFDDYFSDPAREAYLIRPQAGGKPLGFAMIHPYPLTPPSRRSVAEFLILPPYRRQGVGLSSALACFQTYPGIWEVSPSYGSEGALRFWEAVIGTYAGEKPRMQDGVFRFSVDSPLTNAADTI